MRLKNASYSEFSITNTQVSGNKREHANKVSNANVYGTRYNGNKLFGRFHTVKNKVNGSYTATFVGTRLNAQKCIFWGVYMRFWKILSAWVPSTIFDIWLCIPYLGKLAKPSPNF
jgi:hypothetical protein